MRSAEVAKMADVSVRTLRHYHALGLLPEPPRTANGYRDYGPEAVAQVLRVKRLASLGLSLADIKAMAETADQQQLENETLQRLDDELELKIERLQQQRRTIAQLRAEGLDPTLPVRFARALKTFYGDDPLSFSQPGALEADRAALTLAAHFYDEEDVAELERFAERAQAENAIEPLLALEAAIRALEPGAPEEQRADLVARPSPCWSRYWIALTRPIGPRTRPRAGSSSTACWRHRKTMPNAT